MNYTKHYNLLIERAKNRTLTEYKERHHIIPRCMNGTNDKSNIAELTPEEHYVAHQLLLKMYPENSSLIFAAAMMVANRNNNKLYGWLKRKHSHAMSIIQTGEKNSQYGTCWISHIENRLCQRIKINELETYIHAGWVKKRIIDFDKFFERINRKPTKRYNPLKGKESKQWKGYWVTPKGKFVTCKEASEKNNCSIKTIWNRAKSSKFSEYIFEPKI